MASADQDQFWGFYAEPIGEAVEVCDEKCGSEVDLALGHAEHTGESWLHGTEVDAVWGFEQLIE
jgi:hypothetical protein